MSEMLDVYAAEAEARKYRDMAATEFLASQGYKWEGYQWLAPGGLTPRQLAESRAELLEALRGLVSVSDHYTGDDADDTAIWYAAYDRAEAAIALATQRKEPGA